MGTKDKNFPENAYSNALQIRFYPTYFLHFITYNGSANITALNWLVLSYLFCHNVISYLKIAKFNR